MENRPLILTACMDPRAQRFFNAKRQEYFPAERNYLNAHLTLFHKLPPAHLDVISMQLTKTSPKSPTLDARAIDIMFMGFGSAFRIDCPELTSLRNTLCNLWSQWLSPQDRQKFKAHVTFQNKVPADVAKDVFKKETDDFKPFPFKITGLDLWYYDGGPWAHIEKFNFKI